MTNRPMLQPDASKATSSCDEKPSGDLSAPFSPGSHDYVTELAQTLAAHGVGEVSLHLALDLVLNEVVEQARTATGATGAAVALAREGEVECRATTGASAPDLGVRVETEWGLSGACLKSGEVQQCSDTETDPRVNAEACRQLGVRSIVIVPLIDGQQTFGILEVFSARPDAFGERDISNLQVLAQGIADNKRGAEVATEIPPRPPSPRLKALEDQKQSLGADGVAFVEPADVKRKDLWTSVLVVLIIAAAALLGLAIGSGVAAKRLRVASHVRAGASSAASDGAVSPSQQNLTPAPGDSTESAKAGPVSPPKTLGTAKSVEPGIGGLVITQNGKVIYRAPSSEAGETAQTPAQSGLSATRLIHRVEPEYPQEARRQHIQGRVVLDVQVLGTGTVGNITVVAGDPLLAEAAVQAVRLWKYQPYFVEGKPVESQTRITIKFTLPS